MESPYRPNWVLIGVAAVLAVIAFSLRPLLRRQINNGMVGKFQQMQLNDAKRELEKATDPEERWDKLTHLVVIESGSGPDAEVRAHANEVLRTAEKYRNDWNYGNAIHNGNFALGRLALRAGNVTAAGDYLIRAGHTPGSPQFNQYGPNMMLAKELLEKGERGKVIEYFALCGKFWKNDRGQLKIWSEQVNDGREPDFGPNLLW
jgi:hypothetical protein